jgi:hypothetical protein
VCVWIGVGGAGGYESGDVCVRALGWGVGGRCRGCVCVCVYCVSAVVVGEEVPAEGRGHGGRGRARGGLCVDMSTVSAARDDFAVELRERVSERPLLVFQYSSLFNGYGR